MILQQYVSPLCFTESFEVFELALGLMRQEFFSAARVLKHFHTVEPVLDMITVYVDARMVPFPYRSGLLVHRRHKIIQGGKCPVAIDSELRIGVFRIIQELILQSFCGAGRPGLLFRDEVFDAAVGSFGKFLVESEIEVAILLTCHDVAAERRLTSTRCLDDEHAIAHFPST
jgi:hypothetical protein